MLCSLLTVRSTPALLPGISTRSIRSPGSRRSCLTQVLIDCPAWQQRRRLGRLRRHGRLRTLAPRRSARLGFFIRELAKQTREFPRIQRQRREKKDTVDAAAGAATLLDLLAKCLPLSLNPHRETRSTFVADRFSKKEPAAVERAILLMGNGFMQRGIFRSCGFLIGATLCILIGAFSVVAQEPARTQEGVITTFAPLVERVPPGVVTVFPTQTVSRGLVPFPFSDDTLRQFFGGQLPQRQGKQTLQGLGSGVIVSPDGYILTANHVVSGAEEIMVGLGTELRKYKAKKVGTDPGTDVALLKIDEKNLPGITFADSEKARAGDVVLAV